MKKINALITTICSILILTSCGGDKQKSEAVDEGSTEAIDACSWLTKADAEAILGTPVGECKSLVNSISEDGRNAVSQVAYYSESNQGKHVGLMIKRTPFKSNPASKAEYANQAKTEDVMDAGNDLYNAIQQGQDVPGLGDVAFTYELLGHNLMVFWNGNYTMILTVYGEDNDKIPDLQKSIASKVIKNL